jgi:hypothetical protein
VMRALIDGGRTWIKLSGAYSKSKIGPPEYPEATRIAQAFVKAAPQRMVWGSDIQASRTSRRYRTTPFCSTSWAYGPGRDERLIDARICLNDGRRVAVIAPRADCA